MTSKEFTRLKQISTSFQKSVQFRPLIVGRRFAKGKGKAVGQRFIKGAKEVNQCRIEI